MFADDNDGWFPRTLTEAAPYLKITPQNVELLFMGREKDLREAARTLVARDALAQTRSDGRFVRSYTFADGHTEVHAADTMQELAAWETERIIPRELWSKRP